jgi:hypothetical protein
MFKEFEFPSSRGNQSTKTSFFPFIYSAMGKEWFLRCLTEYHLPNISHGFATNKPGQV